MTQPIITLLTDFGQRDGYVGAMEGVALSLCPSARLVHLSHDVPPQDIAAAAFILYQLFDYYPPHTIHCVVVDPGVGSARQAVALRTRHGLFVGPNNGVFSLVLQATKLFEAVMLTNPAYQLFQVSHTFHGRDLFMPVAAHLANGVALHDLGPAVSELVQLEGLKWSTITGQSRIMHIDHFGNIFLDLTHDKIADLPGITFEVAGQRVVGLHKTFAEVAVGEFVAYIGSTRDHVELAVRNGNAAQILGVKVGDIAKIC